MKVIFLDIDGVLNSGDNLCSYGFLNSKLGRDLYGDLFDERCVRYLEAIIQKTGAYIVMSSSWRYAGFFKMQQMWEARRLPGKLIDITPSGKYNPDIGYNEYTVRGDEIQEWINANKPETYCIIDDDSDMLESQLPFFVKTDAEFGITLKDAKLAIKTLGEQ
jgi:hypothetical protein